MKVHQLARGLLWEQEPSLTLECKRLRLLAPKLNSSTDHLVSFDFKSFIKPENGPRSKLGSSDHNINRDPPNSPRGLQVEMQNIPAVGGTRWNPTQEQIGILEMLYRGGMRTPNAEQIEQITAHLGKYGKIEGKNVFYWFQNHKARERQKQKRNTRASLAHSHSPPTPAATNCTPSPTITCITSNLETTRGKVVERDVQENSPYKKCRSRGFDYLEEDQSRKEEEEKEEHRTLELFPLHPEGK